MEELKVGEYVRTKRGEICKVLRIRPEQRDGKRIYSHKSYYLDNRKGSLTLAFIVKHSQNIIDLIEAGDYVNGILVTGKESTLLYTEIKGIDRSGYHIPISQYGDGIKSIVTKEQFSSVEYRLEEGDK